MMNLADMGPQGGSTPPGSKSLPLGERSPLGELLPGISPVLTGPAPGAGNTDTPLLPVLRLQPLSEPLVNHHLLIILATGGTSPVTGKGFQSVFGSQGPYRICGS